MSRIMTIKKDKTNTKDIIARNKRARFDYEIHDVYEAGLVLQGTEVKSLREGKASIAGGFVRIHDDEAFLYGIQINPYSKGGYSNHDPDRTRKLLLNRREIKKIKIKTEQKHMAIVALSLYFTKGKAKVEIATATGKKAHDKRHALKERDIKLRIDRLNR